MQNLLVEKESGYIPVLITAPHGGRVAIEDVAVRKTGVKVRDHHTREVARLLWNKWQQQPYLVMAQFSRKYIDANRPRNWAYESEKCTSYYDEYHNTIRLFIDQIRQKWGQGILIDIHGQGQFPEEIHWGTQNGKTIAHILKDYGADVYNGEASIAQQLWNRGYLVYPPISNPFREHRNYDGGYTVRNYGSCHNDGIDALQLEIGMQYRKTEEDYTKFAQDLVEALQYFYQQYYSNE